MINRVLFSLLLFSVLLSSAKAQVDSVTVAKVSIINAKHKVEGIYKTFDEFRRNEPYYKDSFTVKLTEPDWTGNKWDTIIWYPKGLRTHKTWKLRPFFGFCKNDSVFIKVCGFHPILELGHLSIIWVRESCDNNSQFGAVRGFSWESGNIRSYFYLDYMTGEFFPAQTMFLLDKFEQWDKELYREYRKTKNKKKQEVVLEYIRKFNQRNPIRF